MTIIRRLVARRVTLFKWAAEIAGVAAVAVAAGMWIMPLGIAIVGVYLLIVSAGGE